MDNTKKIWLVILIVGFTVVNYVILTFLWPVIQNMIGVAQADPTLVGENAAEFNTYKSVLNSMPFYLYFIPAIVGVIQAVIVLRAGKKVFDRS